MADSLHFLPHQLKVVLSKVLLTAKIAFDRLARLLVKNNFVSPTTGTWGGFCELVVCTSAFHYPSKANLMPLPFCFTVFIHVRKLSYHL